jgi:hypothetical protein
VRQATFQAALLDDMRDERRKKKKLHPVVCLTDLRDSWTFFWMHGSNLTSMYPERDNRKQAIAICMFIVEQQGMPEGRLLPDVLQAAGSVTHSQDRDDGDCGPGGVCEDPDSAEDPIDDFEGVLSNVEMERLRIAQSHLKARALQARCGIEHPDFHEDLTPLI